MPSTLKLLLFLIVLSATAHAQTNEFPVLNIGDNAPALRVKKWLKGMPVINYKKGTVYIVEFWATWCAPCKAAMPQLSMLARKYKDSVIIIGVSIMEDKGTTVEKVQCFVDSMGLRMDYTVAMQDSNFMEKDWLEASGERPRHGIPRTVVINSGGKIAWFGHPSNLEEVLPKIVNNTWNITEALNTRNINRRLAILDDSLYYDLLNYGDKSYKPGDLGQPDSALIVINEILQKEPGLKYTPRIAGHTFAALLKTDLQKAYEYGKVAIVTSTYEEPPYYAIIVNIERYSNRLKLTPEIYELGARAYQAEIDAIPYPELVNSAKLYNGMAAMYWQANNTSKAIEAQQKAIEALQRRKGYSKVELMKYKASLQKYEKM